MKDYATVNNNSKKRVLEARAKLYDTQKLQVIKVLKENYMITGKISDLPKDAQEEFKIKLLEYWNPKTGINKAGIRLIEENELALSPKSNKDDIRLYIEKITRKHLAAITEAYRQNNIQVVTEAIKEDIEPKIHKTLKETFINNTVWSIVSNRIKMGLE